MLQGIHVLLTYSCTFACDHCFLYSSPSSQGVFSLNQLKEIIDDAVEMGGIRTFFFEGGEPFLYYPIMIKALRMCSDKGFEVGIVTNAYWAKSVEDAKIWLEPLKDLSICTISLSDDEFHYGTEPDRPPQNAKQAAEELGLPVSCITIEKPSVERTSEEKSVKGAPIIGGGTKFKGRAVEKLTSGLPIQPCHGLNSCPHEELIDPKRVHVDPFGNVFVCQGVSIGNLFKQPISQLMKAYKPDEHPIVKPLIEGGPHQLAKTYNVSCESGYIDECHMCFSVRKQLIDQFPEQLTPKQVYGE